MTTVLRVKRRHDSEPQDALILNCKRPKLTDNEEAVNSIFFSTVAKFAGTLKDPKEDVHHLTRQDLKTIFKHCSTNVSTKARQHVKESSIANRYKVISCLRSLDTLNIEEEEEQEEEKKEEVKEKEKKKKKSKTVTLIDVEDSVSLAPNQVSATVESSSNCVYDVYYAETEDVQNDDSIYIYNFCDSELVFETYHEHSSKDQYESEDSNSESNRRNDYPDTDYSDESIDEKDMRVAVGNLSDSNNLSSEDEDIDNFVCAVDEQDVENYGYKYARYKQRMTKLFIDESEKN